MIEKEDRALFPVPFQSSEEIASTWRGFEELRMYGLRIENFLKKSGPLYFIARRVGCLDSEILLEVLNRFIQKLIPIHIGLRSRIEHRA